MQIEKITEKYRLNELNEKDIDLADERVQNLVFKLAEELIKAYSLKELKELDEKIKEFPILLSLAIKLAISKLIIKEYNKYLKENGKTFEIDVIFAVYKEHNRIKTKKENPHGEDFLNNKYKQMLWLFENTNFKWNFIVVDDGCPYDSGKLVDEIAKKKGYKNVKVLFLKDYLEKIPVCLIDTSQSKKGASIILGLYYAIYNFNKNNKNKILIYTDADLSINLAQIGYLIEPILFEDKEFVIGSRREKTSKTLKKGIRNYRGKLFIYFWKKILPCIDFVNDTQCAFKAMTAEFAKDLIINNIEKQFAFDIELILKAVLKDKSKVEKRGIVWIDSEKESNTQDSNIYLDMLKSVVKMAINYCKLSENQLKYINFILKLDYNDWKKLVDNIPKEIIENEPENFNKIELIDKFEKILKD